MFESDLWVPLALLGLIILSAVFFSRQSWILVFRYLAPIFHFLKWFYNHSYGFISEIVALYYLVTLIKLKQEKCQQAYVEK